MKSKKQSKVSHSYAKDKYRPISVTNQELLWLLQLLQDFGIQQRLILLHCDKQVARHIAVNPVFHERTKHIVVDCHIIHKNYAKLPSFLLLSHPHKS